MMLVFKPLLTLLFFGFLSSCSHINHEADVVTVEREVSPTAQALKKTRHQILQNKNSLRIALLKLQFKSVENSRQVIVLDTAHLDFLRKTEPKGSKRKVKEDWGALALARLHGQLVPELYQVLNLLSEIKANLYVLCSNKFSCQILRQNLSPVQLKRVRFVDESAYDELLDVEPLLVLGSDNAAFSSLAKKSPLWRDWNKSWVLLKKVDYDARLKPNDLARVVPTINEF